MRPHRTITTKSNLIKLKKLLPGNLFDESKLIISSAYIQILQWFVR